MAGYLIGCDVGTGGTKSVVLSAEGTVAGADFQAYPLSIPRPGWAEQDPHDYWRAAVQTLQGALAASGASASEILGISLSGLAPACVLVDRQFEALGPSHIWMDRRAIEECQWVRRTLGEETVQELTGNPIDPFYGVTKLLWEKRNEPDRYQEAHKWLNAKDYVLARLTGEALTDYSHAALGGIVFDIRRKRWDRDLVGAIGLDFDKLPEPHPCEEVIGHVTRPAAEATGLQEGTPVVAGGVDSSMAWLSSGIVEKGENCLTLGTTAVWGVVDDEPNFAPRMITYPHAANSRDTYATVGAMVGGGGLLLWFKENLGQDLVAEAEAEGRDPFDLMSEAAEPVPPGSDGLVVLPYFMGERTPIWDPSARGVVFGLSLSHGKGHLIRALMEGVAYGVRHNIEVARAAGISIRPEMSIVEGGARNALWRRIVSDVLDVEVTYRETAGGAPVGNAITAGVGVGVFPDFGVAKRQLSAGESTRPDKVSHKRYTKMYRIYRELYPCLKPHFESVMAEHAIHPAS